MRRTDRKTSGELSTRAPMTVSTWSSEPVIFSQRSSGIALKKLRIQCKQPEVIFASAGDEERKLNEVKCREHKTWGVVVIHGHVVYQKMFSEQVRQTRTTLCDDMLHASRRGDEDLREMNGEVVLCNEMQYRYYFCVEFLEHAKEKVGAHRSVRVVVDFLAPMHAGCEDVRKIPHCDVIFHRVLSVATSAKNMVRSVVPEASSQSRIQSGRFLLWTKILEKKVGSVRTTSLQMRHTARRRCMLSIQDDGSESKRLGTKPAIRCKTSLGSEGDGTDHEDKVAAFAKGHCVQQRRPVKAESGIFVAGVFRDAVEPRSCSEKIPRPQRREITSETSRSRNLIERETSFSLESTRRLRLHGVRGGEGKPMKNLKPEEEKRRVESKANLVWYRASFQASPCSSTQGCDLQPFSEVTQALPRDRETKRKEKRGLTNGESMPDSHGWNAVQTVKSRGRVADRRLRQQEPARVEFPRHAGPCTRGRNESGEFREDHMDDVFHVIEVNDV
ncbi:hypothetical protein R3P38DRAFT_2799402 [Favolaschia claudopus]|uniref:Uncharacterized protein n=1 Tax=Favolaschia claudopus TaxID=2862362 RepID=A0AAV9ZZF5_9AGAR